MKKNPLLGRLIWHALYISVPSYNINIMVFQFYDGSDHSDR